MTKKRKLHQLIGVINHAWLGISKSKQSFYYLEITEENFFGKTKRVIYAFSNLVSPEIWQVLAQETFWDQKYLFACEKRVRGWRLKEWQELND